MAIVTFPFRLLFALVGQLFRVSFMPPLIEAEHLGPPYSKMTWRAASRHVGPHVIDDIAAALERGDRRIRVEGVSVQAPGKVRRARGLGRRGCWR